MNIANTEPLTKLYQRINTKQEQHRNGLLCKLLGEILNHSAKYTVSEDIVMEMSTLEM